MKKILLIDDEKTFAETVKFNLEDTGKYEVRIEELGSNACVAARGYKPDLILLDILMPDVPGDKIAAQLKDCEDTKDIPIVFLTAVMTKDETDRRRHIVGPHPVIGKPVTIDTLINVIDKNIKGK